MPYCGMITHEGIWTAIDRLATSFGYSTSGLSKRSGLDPTAFNRSKRFGPDGKPRWPSTESISRILAATGATMSEFLTFMGDDGAPAKPTPTIPVIGYAQAGTRGFFDDAGYPSGEGWDQIQFPGLDPFQGRVYSLEIAGDSMEPLYRAGDRLVVAPGAAIRRGDRVVVRTVKGEVMVKELARQTASKIELKSINPKHDNPDYNMSEIAWIARVVWVSQ